MDKPLVIKRYGVGLPYTAGEARYVTLGELAAMVRGEEEFVAHDAQAGVDITRSVLQPIIIEQGHHG